MIHPFLLCRLGQHPFAHVAHATSTTIRAVEHAGQAGIPQCTHYYLSYPGVLCECDRLLSVTVSW